MQLLIVTGHLGGAPELRYTPEGTAVCGFSVAATERWTDKAGQRQERTTWYRATAWSKMAEACNQYLNKGDLVTLQGRPSAHAYMGNDGTPRASLDVQVQKIEFHGRRERSEQGAAPNSQEQLADEAPQDDEIPF